MKYSYYINYMPVSTDTYEKIIDKAMKLSVEFTINVSHKVNEEYCTTELEIPFLGLLDMIVYDDKIKLNKEDGNNKKH